MAGTRFVKAILQQQQKNTVSQKTRDDEDIFFMEESSPSTVKNNENLLRMVQDQKAEQLEKFNTDAIPDDDGTDVFNAVEENRKASRFVAPAEPVVSFQKASPLPGWTLAKANTKPDVPQSDFEQYFPADSERLIKPVGPVTHHEELFEKEFKHLTLNLGPSSLHQPPQTLAKPIKKSAAKKENQDTSLENDLLRKDIVPPSSPPINIVRKTTG